MRIENARTAIGIEGSSKNRNAASAANPKTASGIVGKQLSKRMVLRLIASWCGCFKFNRIRSKYGSIKVGCFSRSCQVFLTPFKTHPQHPRTRCAREHLRCDTDYFLRLRRASATPQYFDTKSLNSNTLQQPTRVRDAINSRCRNKIPHQHRTFWAVGSKD